MNMSVAGWVARARQHSGLLTVVGLSAALAVPFLVALAVMYQPRWLPLTETAQMEMRVRDVMSSHPPALGLNGRFYAYGQVGSHPGGLAFYALWPVYWLLGSDGWSLMVSTVTLNLVAAMLAIWLAYRRGSWQAALGLAAVMAVLMRAYTAPLLAEPWNPWVPLVWWVTFLVAVWALLGRDLVALPVAVFAGSLAAQTHVPYLPLVVVLFLAVAVAAGLVVWRERGGALSRPAMFWVGGSTLLGAILWVPPVIQQLTSTPGNMAILVETFRDPPEAGVPLDMAFESWFAHLNLRELVSGGLLGFGVSWPGAVFLGVWAAAAALAIRRRDQELVRLHIVVAVALFAGLLATIRIHGPLWTYLVLWGWGTTAVMILATAWTFWRAVPSGWERRIAAAVGGLFAVTVVWFVADARHAEMRDSFLSRRLDLTAAATSDYLADDPAGCGEHCRYQVSWADAVHVGSEGAGLLVELERRGFDVGAPPTLANAVRRHRVIEEDEADAVIHLAVGEDAIEQAAELPGAVEILSYGVDSLSSPTERAAREKLLADLVSGLEAEGYAELGELASSTDQRVPVEEDMSHDLKVLVLEANELYRPSALFFRET